MKNSLLKSAYQLNTEINVWMRPGYGSIEYSDGDEVEKKVAEIIRSADDLSVLSEEMRRQCLDWPSTYHLHPNRSNLLRPLEDYLKGDVLEIGCGCGAITRFLGESGANVLALEGSARRAQIAASRTRDLENVTVVIDKFNDFQFDLKFDVVTFIGVLEYARKYSNDKTQDGINLALKLAKSYLKPGGVLIVAIENQLGLKYFAGFSEDHFGKPMYGIEDHYDQDSIVTFGRKELGDRVAAAGLVQQEWWLPYPDYKLPTLLISEQGSNEIKDFNVATLVKSASLDDYQYPEKFNFMQERALEPVVRNNLMQELANSFLLVASDIELGKAKHAPLAIHYASDRKLEFTKKVIFIKDVNNKIRVKSLPLHDLSIKNSNSLLKQVLVNDEYRTGEIWQDRLYKTITKPGWCFLDVKNWFDSWFEAFCKLACINDNSDLNELKVNGGLFDAIPRNLIRDENYNFVFIDQEWTYAEDLDFSYIIFRSLLNSFTSLRYVATPTDTSVLSVLSFIKRLMASKNISLSDYELNEHLKQELKLSILSKGFSSSSLNDLISWTQSLKFKVCDTQIIYSNEIEDRDRKIKERDKEIEERNLLIEKLIKSNSWRLTRPLRVIRRTLFKSNIKL